MGISYSPTGYAMHANHLAMQHQQQLKNRQYAHTISHTTVYSQCIHN